MGRFALILFLALIIGISYSYIMNKLSTNKLLLFLPSIIGTLWFIYIFTLYSPKQTEGFGDLAIVIVAMMVFALILGNIISSLVFIYKKRKK